MSSMRTPTRLAAARIATLLATLALGLSACSSTSPSVSAPGGGASSPVIPGSGSPSSEPSTQPALTPVPGGASAAPTSSGPVTTTDTPWGRIVDAIPATFPRYPGADDTDVAEPVTAAWIADDDAGRVAAWYRTALQDVGFSSVELSAPLEDGSMVLDAAGTEGCKAQLTFRPAGESTMISVLYGAGCV